jgi:hypothetical protein
LPTRVSVPFSRGKRRRWSRALLRGFIPLSLSLSLVLPLLLSARHSRGRPTCTGDAQVLRGCAGPSRQKNCRFARKSGTPVSGCQETGQGVPRTPAGTAISSPARSLGMRAGTRGRRFAHRVAPKRQPAPKSAPVSQDSKRRGGSPARRTNPRRAQARRGDSVSSRVRVLCTCRVNDPRVFSINKKRRSF